jgi:hypothetical protein
MESLFHHLAKIQPIEIILRRVFPKDSESTTSKTYGLETKGEVWSDPEILCDKLEVVRGLSSPENMLNRYYRPPAFSQRMYDALIIRSGSIPVDLVKIIVAKQHSIKTEEFKNLFDWLNQTEYGGDEWYVDFRFLMIRMAANANEVNSMKNEPLSWSFVRAENPFSGFPQRVCWFECIFNLEDALVYYLENRCQS